MKPLLLVVAPYYQDISEMLVSGATTTIYQAGYEAEMLTVPGAFEIPAAILHPPATVIPAMSHSAASFGATLRIMIMSAVKARADYKSFRFATSSPLAMAFLPAKICPKPCCAPILRKATKVAKRRVQHCE